MASTATAAAMPIVRGISVNQNAIAKLLPDAASVRAIRPAVSGMIPSWQADNTTAAASDAT